ncbi:MAG: DUF418 domain-containing protein [Alphaproteobacteria bacterium]|nr:DUF418 domain-containing protein [Alphaproteobacteria bacterium]
MTPPNPSRVAALDALRGFALLGIIIVNAPIFAVPLGAMPPVSGMFDGAASVITLGLATGKFFLIFSLLFGFGMGRLFMRATEHGHGPLLRRLGGLFVLGALHALFLFIGDILMLYAVLGLLVWLLRGMPDRVLLRLAGGAMLLSVTTQTLLMMASLAFIAPMPAVVVPPGFLEAAAERWSNAPLAVTVLLLFNAPGAFAAMLLGLLACRRDALPGLLQRHARRLSWLALAAAVPSLAGGVVLGEAYLDPAAASSPVVALASGMISLASPLLSLGLAALMLRIALRFPQAWLVRAVTAAGGMSLTGYILHSVILSGLFLGWGAVLLGSLGAAAVLGLACLTFAAIILFCLVWRRWFRLGPDEWLLRSFVALSWQRIRH